jgi:hypothetical protein
MNINPIKFLKEKLEFQAKMKENKELEEVSRQIYSKLLVNFPSFKLVNLSKKSENNYECVGEFLFKKRNHLVKFAVIKDENEVKINVENIKESLNNVVESYESSFDINDYLKENDNKFDEVLREAMNSKEFLVKTSNEFSGISRIIKFFFEENLTKKGNVTKDDLRNLIKNVFINENYLIDPSEILEVIAKSKKEKDKLKEKKEVMFKREIPYDLVTDEGEVKKVKAFVYSRVDLPKTVDDIVVVFDGDNKEEVNFYNEYYALDNNIKGDILNKITKTASGTMVVPWGYLSPIIRLNKDFLPVDLEEGDVIEVDGFTLKLVNKKENVLSNGPEDEGSYWVFEIISGDKEKDKQKINNL